MDTNLLGSHLDRSKIPPTFLHLSASLALLIFYVPLVIDQSKRPKFVLRKQNTARRTTNLYQLMDWHCYISTCI